MTSPTDNPTPMPMIARPCVADQAWLEDIIGRSLPEELFDFYPFGRRIVVVRAETQKAHEVGDGKVLHIPDQAQQPPTYGWVLSAGQDVGSPSSTERGGAPVMSHRLVGCKVLFGVYSGQPLLLGEKDETLFESAYTLMHDTDIWGLIGQPPPMATLEEGGNA